MKLQNLVAYFSGLRGKSEKYVYNQHQTTAEKSIHDNSIKKSHEHVSVILWTNTSLFTNQHKKV